MITIMTLADFSTLEATKLMSGKPSSPALAPFSDPNTSTIVLQVDEKLMAKRKQFADECDKIVSKNNRIQELMAKSFDDLMESGESAELQRLSPADWKRRVESL